MKVYTIHSQYFLMYTPPPLYNGYYRTSQIQILRDKNSRKRTLERNFYYACELFADEVKNLKNLNRELTREEKERLIFSLGALLELRSTLNKKR